MIVIAQVGTTIGFGLLFDTLVIRAFMTPAIAALLGPWFWWPTVVRQRPARVFQPSSVRSEREHERSDALGRGFDARLVGLGRSRSRR